MKVSNNNNLQAELDAAVNMDEGGWNAYVEYVRKEQEKEFLKMKGEHMGTINNANTSTAVATTTIANTGETVKTNAKQVVNTVGGDKESYTQWWKKADVGLSVPFLPVGYDKDLQKYIREGKGSKWKNKKFEKMLKMSQESLAEHCKSVLSSNGYSVVSSSYKTKTGASVGAWIYGEGKIPVMLIAHLDTVHYPKPTDFVYKDEFITSPQGIGGDDRCGVWMILNIIRELKCHVLFCFDEEVGCVGATKFADSATCKEMKKKGNINYIIELDRRGDTDCVYYDCANDEFETFIKSTGYFKTQYGSCSDISYVAPALGVAAVNLSSGYYHEHHKDEYIDLEAMQRIEKEVKKIINLECEKPFEYIEDMSGYRYGFGRGYGYNYGYGYNTRNNYYDDYAWEEKDKDDLEDKYKTKTTSEYDRGYSQGLADGFDEGYEEGYNACVDEYNGIVECGGNDFRLGCRKIGKAKVESKNSSKESLTTYIIYFKDEKDLLKIAEVRGINSDEALGLFLQKFPKIRVSDILDFGYED